jgi:hypothetical protein
MLRHASWITALRNAQLMSGLLFQLPPYAPEVSSYKRLAMSHHHTEVRMLASIMTCRPLTKRRIESAGYPSDQK